MESVYGIREPESAGRFRSTHSLHQATTNRCRALEPSGTAERRDSQGPAVATAGHRGRSTHLPEALRRTAGRPAGYGHGILLTQALRDGAGFTTEVLPIGVAAGAAALPLADGDARW
jgi:hypothetical protein